MNLPPLRTVRDTPAPGASPLPTASRPVLPCLGGNAVPKAVRDYVGELVGVGLLTAANAEAFVRQVGLQLSGLATPAMVADALVGLKYLTRFQASRALAGQSRLLVLGGYRVLDRLESGSVGVVFLGEHPLLGRRVAIKAASVEDDTPADTIARALGEMRLLAGLCHPHVVTVHDAGRVEAAAGEPGMLYLVLEYVPGGDLERYVYAHGPQPAGYACEWGRQIASALRAVHAAGLVHRDVKPSNLLLTGSRRVKLIDFGLTREFGSTRTQPHVLLGSLQFMAPEQLADAPTAGPAADVYGLGATLFWLMTGQLPVPPARTRAETVQALRTATPRKLRDVWSEVPRDLDALLGRMLARNPAERPTVAEAEAMLGKFVAPALDSTPMLVEDDSELAQLQATVAVLEDLNHATRRQAASARAAVLTALAAVAATKPGEPTGHQQRVAEYVRLLAAELAKRSEWVAFADLAFVDDLARAAAAHDLGLVVTTDAAHPAAGDRVLDELAARHGPALPFLRVLRAAVRHHHEHWDGTGYPDRLAGDHIPPAARLVALADAYDTARRKATHADAVRLIEGQSGTAFDPAVVEAFRARAAGFELTYLATPDNLSDVVRVDELLSSLGRPS